MISKYHNQKYDSSVPLRTGDRRWSQDRVRDFWFQIERAGISASDLFGKIPFVLYGGVCTQGAGQSISFTAGVGYAMYSVEIPDSFASTPPTKSSVDNESIRVEWPDRTNVASGSDKVTTYSTNDDNSTPNYVKLRYYETDGNTRTRAKAVGTYAYEKIPDYEIIVNDVAPTDYDVVIGKFLSNGTTYTFQEYTTSRLDFSTLVDINTQLNYLSDNLIQVRQTALEGKIDVNGYATFLSEVSTDNVELLAGGSNPNCLLTWANSETDYTKLITSDLDPSAWQSLTDIGKYFLYLDYDPSGDTITGGKTRVRPQYGFAFDITKNILMHFDGDNGSTDMIDEYGNTWTAQGNAQLSTADKKFGTASLELDGTGDYVSNASIGSIGKKFCIEFWFHTDNTATTNQAIITLSNAGHFGIYIVFNDSGSGTLDYYISTTGSSWDVANSVSGTKSSWINNQWYHFRMEHDGTTYKAYVDGAPDLNIAEADPVCKITKIYLGASGPLTYFLDGGFDELRFDFGYTRKEEAFTSPVSAYSPDALFFSIPEMRFYEGGPNNWIEKIRLFVGEAIMIANHVDSVVTYALKGFYDSESFSVVSSTLYTKNHNIGCDLLSIEIYWREHAGWNWSRITPMVYMTNYYGADVGWNYQNILVYFDTYLEPLFEYQIDAGRGVNQTFGDCKILARRSF